MPDFGKYTNYTDKTAFSGVVFGAQAPVLEVELNELQEIFNRKLSLLASLMGNSLVVPASGSVSYDIDSMELSIVNCVAISGDFIALIPHANVVMSAENTNAYLRLTEKTVTAEDTLTEYGKVSGETIENPIIDPRVGVETSRRKVITYELECAEVMPLNVPGSDVVFVKVGELATIETDEEGNPVAPGTLGFSVTNVINNLTETLNSLESKVTNLEQNPVDTGMHVEHSYDPDVKRLTLTFTQSGSGGTVSPASIPIATRTTPGLMMVGEGLDVDPSGKVSTNVTAQTEAVAQQLMQGAASVEDVNNAFKSVGVDPDPKGV